MSWRKCIHTYRNKLLNILCTRVYLHTYNVDNNKYTNITLNTSSAFRHASSAAANFAPTISFHDGLGHRPPHRPPKGCLQSSLESFSVAEPTNKSFRTGSTTFHSGKLISWQAISIQQKGVEY